MSRERIELMRLARIERSAAIAHARRIPMHASAAVNGLAEKHPIWMAGGAAALGVLLMSRKGSNNGSKSSGKNDRPSLPLLLGGLAVRALPDVLRLMSQRKAPSMSSPDAADVRT